MKFDHTKKVFILGCERSGSTWLANILDADSRIITYFEPFADYLDLFPAIPSREKHVSEIDAIQKELLYDDFRILFFKKYPYLYKPGRWTALRYFDKEVLYRNSSTSTRNIFESLNVNKNLIVEKQQISQLTTEVIKELRLNFKSAIIKELFPEAKILVSIRNPMLQVRSILNWFEKGRLGELKRNINNFMDSVRNDKRFLKYEELRAFVKKDDMIGKVTLYWIINYEMLIEELRSNQLEFRIVRNEDLVMKGVSELEKILTFVGHNDHSACVDFFQKSSTSQNQSDNNPLNTNRDSLEYLNRSLSKIDSEVRDSVSLLSEMMKLECISLYNEAVN